MAGFLPGFGRGGITHSLEVIDPGVPGPGEGEMAGLAANAGTSGAGAGAIEGVDMITDDETPYISKKRFLVVSLGVVRAGERKCAHQSWRGKGTGANELELNEVKRLSVEVSKLFLSRQNIGGFDFQLIDGTNKRERIELQGTREESEQKPRREEIEKSRENQRGKDGE